MQRSVVVRGGARIRIRPCQQTTRHIRNVSGFEESSCVPVRTIDLRMGRGRQRHSNDGRTNDGDQFWAHVVSIDFPF